jgi:beta-mannosidase
MIVGEPGPGKRLPVIVSNDSRADANVRYRVSDAESGETVASGSFRSRANENWQVADVRTYASDQRLYLIRWETDGQQFGSHYLAGFPPFDLERYRHTWLPAIAALPRPFDAGQIAK